MAELKGWVAIHRSICENDLWFLEPFTKAQAWIDLLLNANHKDGEINIRGNIIHIKRGQIGWSQITMAKRWRWSRQKVRRFLEYLITEQMISIDNSEITPRQLKKTIQQNGQQKKSKLTSITTIINYEQYQTLQQTLQQTIQQKDNRRYINNNDNNVNNNSKRGVQVLQEDSFREELSKQFNLSVSEVQRELDTMQDWLSSTGKKYKDYKAFARNWVRRSKKGKEGGSQDTDWLDRVRRETNNLLEKYN